MVAIGQGGAALPQAFAGGTSEERLELLMQRIKQSEIDGQEKKAQEAAAKKAAQSGQQQGGQGANGAGGSQQGTGASEGAQAAARTEPPSRTGAEDLARRGEDTRRNVQESFQDPQGNTRTAQRDQRVAGADDTAGSEQRDGGDTPERRLARLGGRGEEGRVPREVLQDWRTALTT